MLTEHLTRSWLHISPILLCLIYKLHVTYEPCFRVAKHAYLSSSQPVWDVVTRQALEPHRFVFKFPLCPRNRKLFIWKVRTMNLPLRIAVHVKHSTVWNTAGTELSGKAHHLFMQQVAAHPSEMCIDTGRS